MTNTRANLLAGLTLGLALCASGCDRSKSEPSFKGEPSSTTTEQKPAERGGATAEKPVEPAADKPAEPDQPKLVREPTSPDPLGGKFSLADATAGLPDKGTLHATIETSLGTITCKLLDKKAPVTVANFVGLARGLRPFWHEREAAWVKRPLYDGTSFHRVIPGFMIQGGDQLGDGSGGVGYEIPDEMSPDLKHDRAGLLCMANRGPNTNGGQFFITDASTPHLTQMNSYTIFGECEPLEVISKIARAPKASPHSETPVPKVDITKVEIARKK